MPTRTRLLVVTAVVEVAYGALGLLVPSDALGWDLTPDGEWVSKLLACALLAQAATAWALRHDPPPALLRILGGYQLAATATDATLWLALEDDGIFADGLAKASVAAAMVIHTTLGVLLLQAAARPEVAR